MNKYINSLITLATHQNNYESCNYFRISALQNKPQISRTLCMHSGINCKKCVFNKDNKKDIHDILNILSNSDEQIRKNITTDG